MSPLEGISNGVKPTRWKIGLGLPALEERGSSEDAGLSNEFIKLLGSNLDIGHRYMQKISCGNPQKRLKGMSNVEI